MDYEKASDKSINLEIFELKYGKLGSDKDMLRRWNSGKIDYCSNPAGMWPIIFENGICITPDLSKPDEWIADKSVEFYGRVKAIANNRNKNPLRAAAIVFLKMQEV